MANKLKIRLNPNTEYADEVRNKIFANNGYCPCQVEKSKDTMCMCKTFREKNTPGYCECGLFYKEN